MSRVVFAAGGTGGHIFPALAIAEAMQDEDPTVEIVFVGAGLPIEERLVGAAGYRLATIPFVPVSGAGIKGVARMAAALPGALAAAIRLYRERRPERVVGFGGYPAFIPLLCAWLLRVPSALHEQNVKAGLANRALSLIAGQLYSVHRSQGFWSRKPVLRLANPTRAVFHTLPQWRAPGPSDNWTVLVMGGSQGAVSLNDAVLELIELFRRRNIHVLHQAGARDAERVRVRYREAAFERVEVFEFIDDIAQCYARAHLVICRAGAMTVAEVSAAGRPAIYVPLRIAGGHQSDNVAHLLSLGAARMLPQGPELAQQLGSEIERLLSDPQALQEMATKAKATSQEGELRSATVIARRLRNR